MLEKLQDFFDPKDLEWRIQSAGQTSKGIIWCKVLCYVQARAIQKRLDDVFGVFGWSDKYRYDGKDCMCSLSVQNPKTSVWITKENGATQTDIEAFKGGISGAFKRVASSGYGIGRYLYELETKFAEVSSTKQEGWNKAKLKSGTIYWWKTPVLPSKFLPKTEIK